MADSGGRSRSPYTERQGAKPESRCHGVTPREVALESSVDRTPYLTMAVTPEQRSTYGVGAGIFERMWSGQGCRRGGDRRGVGGYGATRFRRTDATGALGVCQYSAPGCCGKRVLWVSVAQELPRNMRLSISRGLIPLAVFLLSFPLYATFVYVYLVLPCLRHKQYTG